MKKRAEIEAESWTVSDQRIDFFRSDKQVAAIRALHEDLLVDVAGIEAPMKVRKMTLLQDLDWLLIDFELDADLHRVAVRFEATTNYDELNSGILHLLRARATPYFRRNRPTLYEVPQQAVGGNGGQRL